MDKVQDAKVLDCKVVEANQKNLIKKGSSIHESISMSEVKRFEVARNRITRAIKEGICIKDGSTEGEVKDNVVEHPKRVGIYLVHATKVKVFGNDVHHGAENGMLFALGDGCRGPRQTSQNQIYRNTIWANGFNGIQFWRTEPGQMTGNRIFNNVFWGNKHNGIQLEFAEGNIIRNNIIAKHGLRAFAGNTTRKNTRSHNLCWGNRWSSDEGDGESAIKADPKLVKPEAGDFHLRAGSPAIGAGMEMGLPFCGKAPDIGAVPFKTGC
jgi:parallel beta-helix repeat protein